VTATSTSAGDDLTDELEFSGEVFISAAQRRAPAGEREWSGENEKERRVPGGSPSYILKR
jgi:hypothetical protein